MNNSMARWVVGAIVVAAVAACSDGKAPEPAQVGGGSTEDFNGQGIPCTHVVPVALDDERAEFAAAVAQVRNLIEGNYSVPTVWVDPCSSDYECGAARGCGESASPTDVVGTETTIRVSIHATGEDAVVLDDRDGSMDGNENELESQCAEELRIPATVTLTSEDGVLDEEFSVDIWSEDLRSAQVKFDDAYAVSALHGSLSQRTPQGSTAQFHLSVSAPVDEDTHYSQDIHVLHGDTPMLESLTANGCGQSVPKDSVAD